MKVEIISVWNNRYAKRRLAAMVPPLSGIHLAALTPKDIEVVVRHEKVSAVDYDTDADLVALSFYTGTVDYAKRHALEFSKRSIPVVAGGPHASAVPNEVAQWADSVVVGEAEQLWPQLLRDAQRGRLQPRYSGGAPELRNLPCPR